MGNGMTFKQKIFLSVGAVLLAGVGPELVLAAQHGTSSVWMVAPIQLLVGFGVGMWLLRTLGADLQRLQAAAEAIAGGDFDARSGVAGAATSAAGSVPRSAACPTPSSACARSRPRCSASTTTAGSTTDPRGQFRRLSRDRQAAERAGRARTSRSRCAVVRRHQALCRFRLQRAHGPPAAARSAEITKALDLVHDQLSPSSGGSGRGTRGCAGAGRCTTNVMIADADGTSSTPTESVASMLANAEADVRKALPQFSASKVLGSSFDIFHKNPAPSATCWLAAFHPRTEIEIGRTIGWWPTRSTAAIGARWARWSNGPTGPLKCRSSEVGRTRQRSRGW